MTYLVTINHPFQTVDDFHQRAGKRLASLIHRLASKYPQLPKRCGPRRMLLALSVAWALTGLAKDGNHAAFEHIDEALSPPMSYGCTMMPQGGCVMVEGEPFVIAEGEQAVLHFLWDGFAIFIDHEGTDSVGQTFFDFAECRQSKAYTAMGEDLEVKSEERRVKNSTAEQAPSNAQDQDLSKTLNQGGLHRTKNIGEGFDAPPTTERSGYERREGAVTPLPPEEERGLGIGGGALLARRDGEVEKVSLNSRKYLAELVEGVANLGDEHAIRNLLADFSYIPHHDDYLDHLRGILLGRLAELATRLPMVAENHFHGDVGQFIAQGNGYINEQ